MFLNIKPTFPMKPSFSATNKWCSQLFILMSNCDSDMFTSKCQTQTWGTLMWVSHTVSSKLTIVHPEYDGRRQASRRSTWQHQGHALLNDDWLDFLLWPQGGSWIVWRRIHVSGWDFPWYDVKHGVANGLLLTWWQRWRGKMSGMVPNWITLRKRRNTKEYSLYLLIHPAVQHAASCMQPFTFQERS